MANVLNYICYISIIYNAFESKAYASVVPTLNVNGTNIINDLEPLLEQIGINDINDLVGRSHKF